MGRTRRGPHDRGLQWHLRTAAVGSEHLLPGQILRAQEVFGNTHHHRVPWWNNFLLEHVETGPRKDQLWTLVVILYVSRFVPTPEEMGL